MRLTQATVNVGVDRLEIPLDVDVSPDDEVSLIVDDDGNVEIEIVGPRDATGPVKAFGLRKNNAEAIADCARLGYLPEPVLDCTFGLGRFWLHHKPVDFLGVDLDPERTDPTVGPVNFTRLHTHDATKDREWGTVVLDPPYKLNGTPSGKMDDDYGVGRRVSRDARHELMGDGLRSISKLHTRYVLFKCQTQIESNQLWTQPEMFTRLGRSLGWVLVDELHVQSYRPQPAGRAQVHARRDYSTLLVFDTRQDRRRPEPMAQLTIVP